MKKIVVTKKHELTKLIPIVLLIPNTLQLKALEDNTADFCFAQQSFKTGKKSRDILMGYFINCCVSHTDSIF